MLMFATIYYMRRIILSSSFLFFLLLFIIPFGASAVERSLFLGLSGNDVRTLQNELIKKGYLTSGNATGYFGPLTEAGVKKFQCDRKIICPPSSDGGYGVVGPKTNQACVYFEFLMGHWKNL